LADAIAFAARCAAAILCCIVVAKVQVIVAHLNYSSEVKINVDLEPDWFKG